MRNGKGKPANRPEVTTLLLGCTMIAFKCRSPGCPGSFSVKEELAGRKTKCPKCGAALVVPTPTAKQASAQSPSGRDNPSPPSQPRFYLMQNGQQFGPFLLIQMQEWVTAGQIGPDDLVWIEGSPEWVAARKVTALFPPGVNVPAPAPNYMTQLAAPQPTIAENNDWDQLGALTTTSVSAESPTLSSLMAGACLRGCGCALWFLAIFCGLLGIFGIVALFDKPAKFDPFELITSTILGTVLMLPLLLSGLSLFRAGTRRVLPFWLRREALRYFASIRVESDEKGIKVSSVQLGPLGHFTLYDTVSDREKRIEKDAIAGVSIGYHFDAIVAKLIAIGMRHEFTVLAKDHSRAYDENNRHKRARQIGQLLNQAKGLELMQAAWYRVKAQRPAKGDARDLSRCWNGIGKWRD